MNYFYKFVWSLGLLVLFTGCLQDTETELDRAIERDDAILAQYISNNNITATRTQTGFYYSRETEHPDAYQFENGDVVGIYFDIRTLDGQVVKRHMDEEKEPILFKLSNDGIWPIVIAYAAGLAREGEQFKVYSPSYLAFGNYGYQQMVLPNSNLVMEIKFAGKYSEEDLIEREDQMIQDYIAENDLEGFEKIEEGIYFRLVDQGDEEKAKSERGKNVTFDFKLFHLGESSPTMEGDGSGNRPTIRVGYEEYLNFLNIVLDDLYLDAEFEAIVPSFAAFDRSIQIIPFEIREDLVNRGESVDMVRPYTPIFFEAKIRGIM
ncbi:FKBP-type peptidyl-prolyl cis-trans isomerase [Pleomorphovibrio marinus]|uniref:FKBP-type peptidyl-prolyl cis-trans isomerase n=1 Tax=Pleomorphovibrio marinus TaxID=2164132 RepID=UPI001E40EE4B|nr:FKBP-type peptidyl-prolyl cis-trans isomerase [Pleomorphovibrio marinus]